MYIPPCPWPCVLMIFLMHIKLKITQDVIEINTNSSEPLHNKKWDFAGVVFASSATTYLIIKAR